MTDRIVYAGAGRSFCWSVLNGKLTVLKVYEDGRGKIMNRDTGRCYAGWYVYAGVGRWKYVRRRARADGASTPR